MFFLTVSVTLTITIIVNCTSKSTAKTPIKNQKQQEPTNITISKPRKNVSKKKNSVKKDKSKQKSKQKSRLSTLLNQEKTATAMTPSKEEKPRPTPVKESPEGNAKKDGKQMKKETKKKLPERHPASIVSPILSEAINDEKKKPTFKPTTPHRGSEYADEDKNEMRKTAKTQSTTTLQETNAEPAKPTPTANESSARRHRNALKPGEVNDKSDDTIEDAPSVRKREGPSYETVDGAALVSPTPEVLAIKKLSKEKGEETAK